MFLMVFQEKKKEQKKIANPPVIRGEVRYYVFNPFITNSPLLYPLKT